MKLRSFLIENDMTMKELSDLLQCDVRYLCSIARGDIMPGKRLKRDIDIITDGQVTLKKKTQTDQRV